MRRVLHLVRCPVKIAGQVTANQKKEKERKERKKKETEQTITLGE